MAVRVDHRSMQTNPTTWRTTAEACVLLGISERTLDRRLKRGAYPVQIVNNRRLVDCGENATTEAVMVAEVKAVNDETRRSSVVLATAFERVHLAQSAMITRLETEAVQARQSARRWSLVALLGVGASIGLGYGVAVYGERVAQLTASVTDSRQREATQAERVAFLEAEATAEAVWSRVGNLPTLLDTAKAVDTPSVEVSDEPQAVATVSDGVSVK